MNNLGNGKGLGKGGGRGRNKGGSFGTGGYCICAKCGEKVAHEQGVKAITLDDMRWALCNIKATTLLANLLLRQQAVDKGCAEAILIKEGYATEGAASNIFTVIDDVIITPENSNAILPGITRDVIIDLAKANGLELRM